MDSYHEQISRSIAKRQRFDAIDHRDVAVFMDLKHWQRARVAQRISQRYSEATRLALFRHIDNPKTGA